MLIYLLFVVKTNWNIVIFVYRRAKYSNIILSFQSLIKEDEDIDDFLVRYEMGWSNKRYVYIIEINYVYL